MKETLVQSCQLQGTMESLEGNPDRLMAPQGPGSIPLDALYSAESWPYTLVFYFLACQVWDGAGRSCQGFHPSRHYSLRDCLSGILFLRGIVPQGCCLSGVFVPGGVFLSDILSLRGIVPLVVLSFQGHFSQGCCPSGMFSSLGYSSSGELSPASSSPVSVSLGLLSWQGPYGNFPEILEIPNAVRGSQPELGCYWPSVGSVAPVPLSQGSHDCVQGSGSL